MSEYTDMTPRLTVNHMFNRKTGPVVAAIAVAVLSYVMGCVNDSTSPVWNELRLTDNPTNAEAVMLWEVQGVGVSNGVALWNGQPTPDGCVFSAGFVHTDATVGVELSVFRYRDVQSSVSRFNVRTEVKEAPTYKEGSCGGYQYWISESVRPRADPAGGGFYMDKRITYAWIRRQRTLVRLQVNTVGADRRADMDRIVRAVSKLIGEW